MADTIAGQASGAPALGTDEFLINRAGVDFKLTHTEIVAAVNAAIAAELVNRANGDTNLDNTKLNLIGGTLTGYLTLHADPTSALHPTTMQYVDTANSLLLPLGGGTMTGFLTLSSNPTANAHAANKAYVDLVGSTKWANSVDLSCNTNPNYPASAAGTTYRVSVAGKIGGTSGKVVQVDDMIYCHTTDVSGGTQAAVGANYLVIQGNIVAASQTDAGYVMLSTAAVNKAGTDDTTAVSPLGLRTTVDELVPNHKRTVTANTSVAVGNGTESHLYLLTGSGTGAVGVSIPEIAAITGSKQITLTFKDAGNNAATNNVTITPSGSDTIDGAATYVISADSGKVTLVTDGGTNWYTI